MKLIRLTESDLRKVILETARHILTETKVSVLRKYNQDIDDNIFHQIINADPTYSPNNKDKSGKYTKWLLSLYKRDNTILNRLEEISNNLKLYNPNLQPDRATIESVADDNELKQRVESLNGNTQDKNKKSEYYRDIVYDDSDWTIIIPSSYSSSKYWGRGTHWCTASQNPEHYKYYEEQGFNLYINIDKRNDNEKYQFCFETEEYMDSNDDNIAAKSRIASVLDIPIKVGLWYAKYTNEKFLVQSSYLPKILKTREDVNSTFSHYFTTNVPNLYRVFVDGCWNMLDLNQKKFWFDEYDDSRTVGGFYCGVCKIYEMAKVYFLDENGEKINNDVYATATDFAKGYSIVEFTNNKKNILFPNGSYLFDETPISFDEVLNTVIASFNENYVVINLETMEVLYETSNPNEHVIKCQLNQSILNIDNIKGHIIAVILNNNENYASFLTDNGEFYDVKTYEQLKSPKEGKLKEQ